MIFLDRTTGDKYELKLSDGQYSLVATASSADSEPIVRDGLNATEYWKLFVDNGQMGWEATATVQNDTISVTDIVTSVLWVVGIYDGQLQYVQTGVSGTFHGHVLSTVGYLLQTLSNVSYLSQSLGVGI